MDNYLYALDEDFLDFYDPVDYASLDSPSSNDSDQENVFQLLSCEYSSQLSTIPDK
jgi:hypothetical protein